MLEEKNVNLEDIFYNQDGSFKPLTSSEGNTDLELAHLRDTYMESEKKYFLALLSIKETREMFLKYLDYSSEKLFELAITLQEKLEYGELETEEELKKMETMTTQEKDAYHMRKLMKTEGLMCLLFAAARDKAKLLELIKEYGRDYGNRKDNNELTLEYACEEERGLSR